MIYNSTQPQGNFLSQLQPQERKNLLSIGKRQSFQKDDFIFCTPNDSQQVHIMLSGHSKVFHASPSGKEIILWFCFPGEIFGLAESLCNETRKVFAQTCNSASILSIPEKDFQEFAHQSKHTSSLVMRMLASRQCLLSEALLSIATEDAEQRLSSVLKRLAKCYGEDTGTHTLINFPITHQEIADMIGTSRQTVTTLLNKMKRSGILHTEKHKIYLSNEKQEQKNIAPQAHISNPEASLALS